MQNKQLAHQCETVNRIQQLNVAYNTVVFSSAIILSLKLLTEICYETTVVSAVQHSLPG